jgi:protein SCO1/2
MILRFVSFLLCLFAMPSQAHIELREGTVAFDQRVGQQAAIEALFADESGRRAGLGARMAGKPAVLMLGYFGCANLCDTTLTGIVESLHATRLKPGEDYRAFFVSIDPMDDASVSATEKARRIPSEQQPAWNFLSSGKASIGQLAGSVGFRYLSDAGTQQYAHPAGFVVIAPDGTIARYFPGVRFAPDRLRSAIVSAASNRPDVAPADTLLLLCYHFDPGGKHTGVILAVLQALAIALVGIAAGLAWRCFREREQRRP